LSTADNLHDAVPISRLTRPGDHHSAFKYVGLNTKTSWDYFERTLNQHELVGATANALNDPFELSPFIFDDLRADTVAAATGFNGLLLKLQKLPAGVEENFPDMAPHRQVAEEYLARITRYSRVVSFCERSDSPLLWSHYAHSYQGACLHFVGRAFSHKSGKTGFVTYSEQRPTYPLSLALRLSNPHRDDSWVVAEAESDKLIYFSKAREWAYENEIRSVYNANSQSSASFNPLGLISVIVGPRMASEDIDRVKRLVAASPLRALPIRRARLSTNSFSVEID
tara:strand:+ start:55311 stop:56156 length:846 start_codon:yes stop_codon:yes gene_type:complete